MSYFLNVTNKRPHMIVFSLGTQLTFEPPDQVSPKLVLEPGQNKIAVDTLKAQPVGIRRAWDDLKIGGVIEVEPWPEVPEAPPVAAPAPAPAPAPFESRLAKLLAARRAGA